MDRITIGAALGGAAVYFLDPQRGEDRRRRVQSFWRENRDTAFEVAGGVSEAAESVRPLVRRVKRGFGRGDWTEGGRPNWVPGVTAIIIAAALGSALIYFLDPENGPARRQRVLSVNLRAKPAANEAAGE
jgi:NAD(P)-dependent dehydrogenase (short-subunit alcohol dehydrogenase family)